MSFWYGLPYRELRHEMPFSAIQAYLKQLPARQAELRLMLGEAANVPYLGRDERRQWSRELQNKLNGEQPARRGRVVSPAMLASKGILVTKAN